MFKRVLVLVIFLFGVFWWLTSRDNQEVETPIEVITVETTETTENEENVDNDETPASETTETTTETDAVEITAPDEVGIGESLQASVIDPTPTKPVVVITKPQPTPVVVTTPAPDPTFVVTPETTPEPQPLVETEVEAEEASVEEEPVEEEPMAPVVTIPNRTTDIKVYVYDSGLDLSDKTIPAGTINFNIQNDGRFTHDFNISGFGNLGKVMPSEKKTFTLKLAAGDYEAFSERRLDYERGVREDFIVVE
ncbi:hypothetical protein GW777_06090 [Candidatus Peregrinibacteria bacterium]|nr:hypothetical protein [bacterium]NCQ56106.1 hypothetical protein [Candidatus Parcubacteria bacterium]NCS67922.1 hypothetical protein [Candidatus Peregrinibacteria bacterium]